jgi:hypothetical protein
VLDLFRNNSLPGIFDQVTTHLPEEAPKFFLEIFSRIPKKMYSKYN